MFRNVWQVVKALIGRQDGRVPADPELHQSSFSLTSAALPDLECPAPDTAPALTSTRRRPCPLPPGQSLRQAPHSNAAEIGSLPAAKPFKRRKLLAGRLATVAKLNGPAAAKRTSRKTIAPAGKAVPRAAAKRKVRSARPQAWIIAGRRAAAAAPPAVKRPTARILAFPQGQRAAAQRPRKAA